MSRTSSLTWIVLLGYLILVGGTPGGEFNGWIRALNGTIAVILIVRWVLALRSDHEATDRGMLLSLIAFLSVCVLSAFPRQSFDAAIQAMALVAGFYFARRGVGNRRRTEIESAAGWLCVALGTLVCLAWASGWVDWLNVSGGSLPPLSLPLATGPFGHRHDVALLVTILAPALWSPAFRNRRAVAIVGTILVVVVVLADSSRNLELAILAASVGTVLAYRVRVGVHRLRIAGGIALAMALTATVFVFQSPALLSRITNLANIVTRFSLWNEAGTVWLSHPVAGLGPGSFPFSYMMSDHFQTSLFDPRHPDNAIVQLLVEGGVVGLVAALVCVATFIRGARERYRVERRAVWALLVFAFATLGANPTDFVFLIVPILIWAAMLVPALGAVPSRGGPARRDKPPALMKAVLACASAVIVVTVSVTGAAAISYEIGRDAYLRADIQAAEAALEISAALDPSLAIYSRERASLALGQGDVSRAAAGYRQSLGMSPYDPVAWRGLALALLADSDVHGAVLAASNAVDLMFLLPENQLVRAATAGADRRAFDAAVAVAMRSQPWLAVISWDDTILDFSEPGAAARRAVNTEPYSVFLALIVGRPDIAEAAAKEVGPFQGRSAEAVSALASCDILRASHALEDAAKVEGEEAAFWIARPILSAASTPPGLERDRIAQMSVRYFRIAAGPGPEVISALAGDISDVWRYRRISLGVAAEAASIPSGRASMWILLNDPSAALARIGTSWPPGCSRYP